jgi:hypothetical protein
MSAFARNPAFEPAKIQKKESIKVLIIHKNWKAWVEYLERYIIAMEYNKSAGSNESIYLSIFNAPVLDNRTPEATRPHPP